MAVPAVTKKDLATISGYTYRRLFDIDSSLPAGQKLFVPDPNDNKKCDLAVFVQHWVQYREGCVTEGAQSLEEARTIHEKIKTEKTRLEVARLKGELIDISDVNRLWCNVAHTCVNAFQNFCHKVAPRLVMLKNPEEISDILESEINKILETIADTPIPEETVQPSSDDEDED